MLESIVMIAGASILVLGYFVLELVILRKERRELQAAYLEIKKEIQDHLDTLNKP